MLVLLATLARAQVPVTLSWDPPVGDPPTAYVVQWGPAPGMYVASTTIASTPTTHVLEGLQPGLRYFVTVVAVDEAGRRSAPSNEVAVLGVPTAVGEAALVVRDGLPRETLAVTSDGAGRGVVAVRPGAGNCAAACAVTLPRSTPVILAATPLAGSRFAGWEGCDEDASGTCLLRLDSPRHVVARFEMDGEAPSRFSRYLAEGAVGDFFDTRVALANPGGRPATARLRFLRGDGEAVAHDVVVAPLSTAHVDAAGVPGLAGQAFSTVIGSDVPLVVDRTMSWRGGDGVVYGAHAESALQAPAARWYLAEGATHAGFDLFYLLQNPQDLPVTARITYLRSAAPPLVRDLVLPARSRTSIWVDEETFGADGTRLLQGTEVSGVVEALDGRGIVVERAMYHTREGVTFESGHESAGVTAPAPRWYFAEGATGPFFDQFLLVANPQDVPADLLVTYLLPGGTRVRRAHRVGARQRYTIWVDQEGADLEDTAVSSIIEASVPVVAERSMWWPGTSATWREAHNAAGATRAGLRWAVADGNGGAAGDGRATYLLIANPGDRQAVVRVTLLFGGDVPPATRTVLVAAHSRFGLSVGDTFPEAHGLACGALVESVGAQPAPIIVERAMYADAAGQPWASGTNLLATMLP